MPSVTRDEFAHTYMVMQHAIINRMRAKLEEQRRARRPQTDAALAFSDAAAEVAEEKKQLLPPRQAAHATCASKMVSLATLNSYGRREFARYTHYASCLQVSDVRDKVGKVIWNGQKPALVLEYEKTECEVAQAEASLAACKMLAVGCYPGHVGSLAEAVANNVAVQVGIAGETEFRVTSTRCHGACFAAELRPKFATRPVGGTKIVASPGTEDNEAVRKWDTNRRANFLTERIVESSEVAISDEGEKRLRGNLLGELVLQCKVAPADVSLRSAGCLPCMYYRQGGSQAPSIIGASPSTQGTLTS